MTHGRGAGLAAGGDDSVLVDLAVDGGPGHAQRLGRADLVALVILQALHDRVPLDGLQRGQQPPAHRPALGRQVPRHDHATRRRCTTCLSTCQSCSVLPGQLCRSSSCIASGEQVSRPCWLSRARKNGTSSCRSSMWWRSGGSSTVPWKNRSSLVRSVADRLRFSVIATRSSVCRLAVLASCSALTSACTCLTFSRSACLMISMPTPSASSP